MTECMKSHKKFFKSKNLTAVIQYFFPTKEIFGIKIPQKKKHFQRLWQSFHIAQLIIFVIQYFKTIKDFFLEFFVF